MRSSCCILFTISLLAIALADDPDVKVSETFYLCDIEVLTNLTSEFGATNEILRSGRESLQPTVKRMENDLNDIKAEIHGISEIKANGKRLLEALDKNYMPSSCSQVLEAGKTGMERVEKDLNDIKTLLVDGQLKIQRLENDLQNMNTKIEHLLEGSNKVHFPSSCSEALKTGKPSGVYRLHIPLYNLEPFDVYCMEDPDKGPAWTVIQRRQDGSEDFYRDWESYKNGFGNSSGEYWIGLDRIHAMTSYQPNSLWIKLGDFMNETSFAKYEKFAISGERENYTLSTLGSYDGTAGDSLTQHLNMMFSTKDRDTDDYPKGNCATYYEGGWWFRKCYHSNLNGPFKTININDIRIAWNSWGDHKPLKYSHMAIRPIN